VTRVSRGVPASSTVYTYAKVDRLLKLTNGTARRWIQGYRRALRYFAWVT